MSLASRLMSTGLLLAGIGLAQTGLALSPEDQRDIETQCRTDAETYGIPPEQLSEYIDGCIMSMGGYLNDPPQEGAPEDAAPDGDAPYDDTFAVESTEPEADPGYADETP